MKTGIMILITGVISMVMTLPVSADLNEQIEELTKAIKEGKGYIPLRVERYPKQQQQYFRFNAGGVLYIVDVKARLCFAGSEGKSLILCQAIKKGYPLIAPIITWEKDGHAQ